MKTKYESIENCITVSVLSDGGHVLHAIAHVFLDGLGDMRYVKSYQLTNIDLSNGKFSVFCRSIVNSNLSILLKRSLSDFVEPDPELDFELRSYEI